MEDWQTKLILYVVLLVSLVFHEAAHALLAKLGGDLTAYDAGQVTLNPIPHIRREPFGTVILPIIMLATTNFCIGFAHAPYDPHWAARHPRRAALMALAGPAANFALATAAAVGLYALCATDLAMYSYQAGSIFPFVPVDDDAYLLAATKILWVFVLLNLALGILNLLPLPPLDGASVVEGIAPATRRFFGLWRQFPMMMILTFIAAWRLVPKLLYPVADWALDVIR